MTVKDLIGILSTYPNDTEIRIDNNQLQVYKASIQLDEDEKWEPTMDDFGTCDVADIY